jgi:hypothetical protein
MHTHEYKTRKNLVNMKGMHQTNYVVDLHESIK